MMGPTRHREGTAGEKGPGRCFRTCEGCLAIDVREWHRDGLLRPGQNPAWPLAMSACNLCDKRRQLCDRTAGFTTTASALAQI